ncbi:hypothetical protein AB0K24_50345, partial [Streptomyces mirabilis]|uniref:hypothetical protein n=1 Tax=Streptomyces mirabilis TaxID=68239 RepID=UPI00342B813A
LVVGEHSQPPLLGLGQGPDAVLHHFRQHLVGQQAANVLFGVPDDAHEEIITLITAVARAPKLQAPELAAVFGEWCWLVYTSHGDVIEVLDVGCAR